MWTWFSRCVPGISLLLLIALLAVAFPDITRELSHLLPWSGKVPATKTPGHDHGTSHHPLHLSVAQKIFIGYTLLVHLNAATFVVRLAWALWRMTFAARALLRRRPATKCLRSPADPVMPPFADSPIITPISSEVSDPMSFDLGGLEDGEGGEVVHAIILPNYSEDLETLRTTLNVLASHPRAVTQYEIFLAMEQKEVKAPEKAATLISSFQGQFRDICGTFHPSGLPREISGKGSNVAWAAKHIVETRSDSSFDSRDVIITVMDADTHLSQDYFNEIRRIHWRDNTDADRAFYASPIIFDRNSNDVPVLVRCADLLWSFAGISAMYPGCAIVIPTSVYSLPLALARRVGGWDGDSTAIGEDMHMLLKCYFETAGDVITHVIASPASQCNISSPGDGNCGPYLSTLLARYRQALRHMWGALDTGYSVRQSVGGLSGKGSRRLRLQARHVALLHLLFEAHFLPCHLTVLLLFSALYTAFVPVAHIHPTLVWAFFITGFLRGLSFVGMNVCITLYDHWYSICIRSRANDMAKAGLNDTGFSFRKWNRLQQLAERICFPIAGTVFGSIPAIHAELSHFFTDKLVYRVSKKPTFTSPLVRSPT
ncbi:hypothetical protein TSTA_001940 [Talaromyces stipitatus ATCC 10500]|uniref:Glycosyltransferase 2-like domain-containing protein n=1 Tax=Talaromyces stipitatus (strain ATCC 10500 / CBS 375.48 / QM 6759 / NRRL 1006) TaxID=441959 RepID=B8MS68_TALSN|nr:uncharacterized protein TSTA_001940 [Talaromyces stipitatus ATCC 10500]EED12126.1 hypothetical protein TSTA_001940 [Talaromyces stipitatus ATCC 10500]